MKETIYILLVIVCYLYGSIPFALVIGKCFYKTDIRSQGSGNLGGTNAGRVLGKAAGISVIILDASKCYISILLAQYFIRMYNLSPDFTFICAFACIVGHCYPIFAGFRGGKAVSVAIGYLLAINGWMALFAIVVFLTTLKLSKYVSLASILGAIAIVCVTPFGHFGTIGSITNCLIALLLIYKHKDNIKRLMDGTESKISWM